MEKPGVSWRRDAKATQKCPVSKGKGRVGGGLPASGRERVAVDVVFSAVVLRKHGCRRQGGDAGPKVETGFS
jgi:hypothetical protein